MTQLKFVIIFNINGYFFNIFSKLLDSFNNRYKNIFGNTKLTFIALSIVHSDLANFLPYVVYAYVSVENNNWKCNLGL